VRPLEGFVVLHFAHQGLQTLLFRILSIFPVDSLRQAVIPPTVYLFPIRLVSSVYILFTSAKLQVWQMFEQYCQWSRGFSPSYLPSNPIFLSLVKDKMKNVENLLNFVYRNSTEYFSIKWLLNNLWGSLLTDLPM
jgi:hypothetical protein